MKKSYYRGVIAIGMTRCASIHLIRSVFGGDVWVQDMKRYNLKNNNCHCLRYGKKSKIAQVIKLILPYLKLKKSQALLLLEFVEFGYRKGLKEELQALKNRRGSKELKTYTLESERDVLKTPPIAEEESEFRYETIEEGKEIVF